MRFQRNNQDTNAARRFSRTSAEKQRRRAIQYLCVLLPRISRERVTDLRLQLSLMCRISVRNLAASGSTDFSLCAFPPARRSKPHRLKPVLLECAGPA
jgi:hypothetical protein